MLMFVSVFVRSFGSNLSSRSLERFYLLALKNVLMMNHSFRFIYWNSHFYGANFYGWSIGDSRSLFESGPFHAQGE